jgi:hypothetical protein
MLDDYCVKICKDFSANFGNKRINWLLHHDNAPSHTSFFTRDFFYQKEHDCRPPPTLLFFVSPIEGRYFDTIEVIQAESQAALNALTEHDFQDAFKK